MADLTYVQATGETKIVGQDASGNQLNQVGADTNGNMLVKDAADGVDGSTVPAFTTQIGGRDGSGNLQTIFTDTFGNQTVLLKDANGNNVNAINNQIQTRDVINTAIQARAQSVTTSAAEALGAASILANRKFLSITPTNGTVYWGPSGVTTATGTPIPSGVTATLSFTDNIHVFVISTTTVDCRIVEGS